MCLVTLEVRAEAAPMEQKKQPQKYSKDKGEPMPYPCDQKAFSKISLIQKLTG